MQHIPGISCSFTDLAIYIAAFLGAELSSDCLRLTPDSYSSKHAIHLQIKCYFKAQSGKHSAASLVLITRIILSAFKITS